MDARLYVKRLRKSLGPVQLSCFRLLSDGICRMRVGVCLEVYRMLVLKVDQNLSTLSFGSGEREIILLKMLPCESI